MKKKRYYLCFRDNGFLAGCDYSKPEKQDGFFFNTFVQPMKHLLQWLEMMYLITTMD